jgi:RNA-binding motif X-linked protein 2
MGRMLRVDHTRYKKKDDDTEEGANTKTPEAIEGGIRSNAHSGASEIDAESHRRPRLKEEQELANLIRDHDDDDPMKAFLIEEKKEQISLALASLKHEKSSGKDQKRRHRHHRSHRSRDRKHDGDDKQRSKRHDRGNDLRRSDEEDN